MQAMPLLTTLQAQRLEGEWWSQATRELVALRPYLDSSTWVESTASNEFTSQPTRPRFAASHGQFVQVGKCFRRYFEPKKSKNRTRINARRTPGARRSRCVSHESRAFGRACVLACRHGKRRVAVAGITRRSWSDTNIVAYCTSASTIMAPLLVSRERRPCNLPPAGFPRVLFPASATHGSDPRLLQARGRWLPGRTRTLSALTSIAR